MEIAGSKKRWVRMWLALIAASALIACTGPESGDDSDPTPEPTNTPVPTETPTRIATPVAEAATPATAEPTATPTPPTATSTPTATPAASPSGSPVAGDAELVDQLPQLEDLPGEGYVVAEQGTRTAQELANAYSDPAAHLQRLNEWGFKRHVFRAFSRDAAANDTAPPFVLATINEYGSDEQAEEALAWLTRSAIDQGASEAQAPNLGDSAAAVTVPTAEGTPTASIYVRRGPLLYVYFAQGGDAVNAVSEIAANTLGP